MSEPNKKIYSTRSDQTPPTITIRIKTMNGTVHTICANPYATVSSIQQQIQQKTSVPVDSQRLLHKAVLLQPAKYLSQYGINDGDTVQIVANMLPEEVSSPSISTHRQSEVARTNTLIQQNLKTKKHRYLQQRINGFSMKSSQSIQTIKQNKLVIDRLLANINNNVNNKQKSQPFLLENRQLNIGDWVDVRDVSGLWLQGQVVGKKHNFVQLHCNGYPDRYNQWIQQNSQRLMPLRTQTVQSQDSPYLSPFPINRPQIKNIKNPTTTLQKILTDLPQTLKNITYLFQQLQLQANKLPNHPEFKYSFNQQQQQDIAQSFKNNRSHHSPPHSIHQQQYQYQDYEGEIMKLPIIKGAQIQYQMQNESSSIKGIKGMIKAKNNRKQLMRSNRYIESKSSFLGYSKTKSQHEHSLYRQQTPQKIFMNMGDNGNKDNNNKDKDKERDKDKKEISVAWISNINAEDKIQAQVQNSISKKLQVMQPQKEVEHENQQELQVQTPKAQSNIQQKQRNHFQLVITQSANKSQSQQLQNERQQNISNKGEHDDGQSSAKSFGSKRSDRFLDASSMKSLNIDTLHTHNENVKDQKNIHGKKNIFLFDQSEAQSVKEMQIKENKQGLQRSNYYYNQEGILEEEDSQINQETNEQYFLQKKKEMIRRLRATQLAPLCDRLGRLLVDLSPHLATLGYQEYNQSMAYNENLSTFTNEGSLQSRFKNFNQGQNHGQVEEEIQEKSSYRSNKYWSFQVPVMLTPWEIMKLNKLLAEDRGETQ